MLKGKRNSISYLAKYKSRHQAIFNGKLLPHNFVFHEVTIKILLYTLFVIAEVDVASPGMLSCSSWLVRYKLLRFWQSSAAAVRLLCPRCCLLLCGAFVGLCCGVGTTASAPLTEETKGTGNGCATALRESG